MGTECDAWMQRIHEVQTSRMSPEMRDEIHRRVERQRVAESSRMKVKAVKGHAMRSKALVSEGLRQMESASNASDFKAVHDRWQSAAEASERRQVAVLSKCRARCEAKEAEVLRVAEEEEEEEAAGFAEAAQLVGAAAPAVLRRAVSDESDGGGGAGEGDDFQKLLNQLQREPTNDEELAAKFGLYETYGEQVQKMRGTLFGLYDENKETLPDSVKKDTEKQLKNIDSAEAMGIPDDARGWFVYHMMKRAGRNNETMNTVMTDFEKKLEFLANSEQNECPICLEDFTADSPAETLGCCHKVCRSCWEHWTEVMHGHPFCPLCRNEEFVETLVHRRRVG